jgi:hypothetical protein
VHALMSTVLLLGLTRFDALHLDSESHPPNRQITQSLDRARRERTAVIGAHARWQTILSENPFEACWALSDLVFSIASQPSRYRL